MGKGDKRSRRGKIFAGSHGKTRPKNKKVIRAAAAPSAPKAAPAPAEKPKARVKKKAAESTPAS
jgi:30S ribosomal protein S31